jgi:hypothetical protein
LRDAQNAVRREAVSLRYASAVAAYAFTDYFEKAVLKKRPYLRKE